MLQNLIFFSKINYNINPPLPREFGTELGLWSLSGITTNLKSHIHFYSDPKNGSGGIGSRLPMYSDVWEANFKARVDSGSLIFSFTDEVFPISSLLKNLHSFSGFLINITKNEHFNQINISSRIYNDYHPISIDQCTLQANNFSLFISKNSTHVKIFIDDFKHHSRIQCGHPFFIQKGQNNYFSFIATSSFRFATSSLFSFRVSSELSIPSDTNITQLDEFNRQRIIIQDSHHFHIHKHLNLTSSIIREISEMRGILNGDKYNVSTLKKNIRGVLIEIYLRLNKILSANNLKKIEFSQYFIQAEEKIMKRRETLQDIQNYLLDSKSLVKNEMKWMNEYVLEEMEKVKIDSIKALEQYVNKTKNISSMILFAKKEAKEIKYHWFGPILLVISFVECLCYLGFFFQKKKKTKNFKKMD